MSAPSKSRFLLELALIYDLVASEETSSLIATTVKRKFSELLTRCISESTALTLEFLYWIKKEQGLSPHVIDVIFQAYSEQGYLTPGSERLPEDGSAEIEWLKEEHASKVRAL